MDVTRIKEYRQEAAKLTGEASLALLFRHVSVSRLVTIAQIERRGRGAASEFVLACDMRFAAQESAIFGRMEAGSEPPWSADSRHEMRKWRCRGCWGTGPDGPEGVCALNRM